MADQNTWEMFKNETGEEYAKAIAKFREQQRTITALTLAEESGEAIRAFLHAYFGDKTDFASYRRELAQVAAMAYRLYDESFEDERTKESFGG